MASFEIGLSGLAAAQSAFDIIGNNIANAATPGYHRQRIELTSAFAMQAGSTAFIGGVNVEGTTRMIDTLLEQEILRQQSILGAVSQETSILKTIETAFGEFAADGGLNAAIDAFFNAMRDLASHPDDSIWQNQLVSAAESMTSQFRTLGSYLSELDGQMFLQAENSTESINVLIDQIAKLNGEIEKVELVGGQAHSMKDQRDQCISKLSELIGVQVIMRDHGVVDIGSGGLPLVTGSLGNHLETGYDSSGRLGLSIVDAGNFTPFIEGGSMGGLLELKNNIVADLHDSLDTLANAVMTEINRYQVMGVGSAGSFTHLTSAALGNGNLSELDGLSSGEFMIRLTDTTTQQVTRYSIPIDPATDTVNDVAAAISAITGLTASVNTADQLTIAADPNYTFDFLPCVLPEPSTVDFDDAAPPTVTVSGIYQGVDNDTLTCTVIGDGAVGNGTLKLEVRDSGNELLKTLNIGAGYAAGDTLELGNGILIAVSIGNLAQTDGDNFTIDAFATTDTANFLAAAGLNTFFAGNSAENMTVSNDILQDPRRVATALGAEMTDNFNVTRMADLADTTLSALDGMTAGEYYRAIATDIGQHISTKQLHQENVEVMVLNLENQRSEVSGVDINEESAKLLIFEQMYQSMAKYLAILDQSMDSLMDLA